MSHLVITQSFEVRLSLKGLQIASRVSRNIFVLDLGSDRFRCDRFQAAFLSNFVAVLEAFLGGDGFTFDVIRLNLMESLCITLGNLDLTQQGIKFLMNDEELNTSNWLSRSRLKSRFQLSTASEVAFATSYFNEFSIAALREVEPSDVFNIVNDEALCPSSDECLLSSLLELGCNIGICLVLFDLSS
jgi:hypothetical protein